MAAGEETQEKSKKSKAFIWDRYVRKEPGILKPQRNGIDYVENLYFLPSLSVTDSVSHIHACDGFSLFKY